MNPRLTRVLLVGLAAMAYPLVGSAAVLSHWKFDETSGLIAADSGGTFSNNAVWQNTEGNALDWEPGLIGGAARMTGEQDGSHYFNVGAIEAQGATQLSYSVWVKPDLVQVGGSGPHFANKGIFTTGGLTIQRSAGPTANQFWGLTWEATPQDAATAAYRFRVDNTGVLQTTPVYAVGQEQTQWIHFAFTWDGEAGNPGPGDEVVKVYVNGAPAGQATNRNASQIISDGGWVIGKDRDSPSRNFAGLIDDLAVWDTVLSDEDVTTIYQKGLLGIDAPTALLGDVVFGDVNGDGLVNSADFNIIQQNFWQPFTERTEGDIVDNDFVDFADYAQWKQAVKDPNPLTANSHAVPEPSALFLMLSAAVLFARQTIRSASVN